MTEGQRQGEIRNDVPPSERARFVLRTIAGIAAFSRLGSRPEVSDTLVRLLAATPRK